MEAEGKIIFISAIASGISKSTGREWMSQEFVIEVPGQYPRKINFRLFGQDRINNAHIQMGDEVKVSFDIDARESQGRWFNSINAYRIEHVAAGQPQMSQPSQPFAQPAPQPPFQAEPFAGAPSATPADDLPF